LMPHPENFAPISALALFGGAYLDKKHTFIVPIAALLISDYFIGFYRGMEWIYGSFIAIGFIGLWLRSHPGIGRTIGATVTSSILFFVITNFGVWTSSQVTYVHNMSGLLQCYVAALPFLRNTIIGDLFYVGALFGAYEMARRLIPSFTPRPGSQDI